MKKSCLFFVLLAFAGLETALGQWDFNGNHIYNTNTENVGIGTGTAFVPASKLHINNASNVAGVMAESSYTGMSQRAIGFFRVKNTATGDMMNISLRKNGTIHEMLQSCYDAGTSTWREYAYFNYSNGKYEMRNGIIDAEFKNSGHIFLNCGGNVGIGTMTTIPWADLDVRSSSIYESALINVGNSDISHRLTLGSGRENAPDPFLLWNDGDNLRFRTFINEIAYEKMRITSAGNVGIGTENPLARLHLKGTGYPESFLFLQSDIGEDAGMRIYEGDEVKYHLFNDAELGGFRIGNNAYQVLFFGNQAGNVGIGTSNPLARLHIQRLDEGVENANLMNEDLVIEDIDAVIGLYSRNDIDYSSGISMGEMEGGALNNKWSIYRTTTNNSLSNQLRFAYGTNPGYQDNAIFMTLTQEGSVGIGTAAPASKLEVTGTVHSTSGGFKFPDGTIQSTAASFPAGVIVMWSGLLANIPVGWTLCDGTNGTPDLRDRFIYGTSAGEDPGTVGGATTHNHTVNPPVTATSTSIDNTGVYNLMPSVTVSTSSHQHSIDIPSFNSGSSSTLPPYYKLAFIMKL